MPGQSSSAKRWWGKFSLSMDRAAYFKIGPMDLWIQRFDHEWRVSRASRGEALEDSLIVAVPTDASPPETGLSVSRFSLRRTGDGFSLWPELPDRPVVIQPETPLWIPGGEEVTLYVNIPLWLRFEVASGDPLLEFPIFRPSDTWFGPSTREGEICYASRTKARLRLADVPVRPHRATTPLLVRNLSRDPMPLHRLNLPIQYLSIYSSPDGAFWTPSVTMEKEKEAGEAGFLVGSGPPVEAPSAEIVSGPRQPPETGLIKRAFGALFD